MRLKEFKTRNMSYSNLYSNKLLCKFLGKECINDYVSCYVEPHRFYHNLDHLSDLMYRIKNGKWSLEIKEILEGIALFHDVVYNPHKTDNEYLSAERFYGCANK